MSRVAVRRVEPPRSRRALDGLLLFGGLVVLLLAVFGVVSAVELINGTWHSSTGATPVKHPSARSASSRALARRDTHRARAQATVIIHDARVTAHGIVHAAIAKEKRAAGAVARATAAAQAISQVPTLAPAPAAAVPTAPVLSPTQTTPLNSIPDLGKIPASWQIVVYNPTFGNGPGSAGSITATNRGHVSFSGIARVSYYGAHGPIGYAQATFTNLPAGQTVVLPLNGKRYPPGAHWRITVLNLRQAQAS